MSQQAGKAVSAVLAFLVLACSPGGQRSVGAQDGTYMIQELTTDLALVRSQRILFLHHSVGDDIIAAVRELAGDTLGDKLTVAPVEVAEQTLGPLLAEDRGGRNAAPKSKIDAFATLVRTRPNLRPDLAFLKLCFADFDPRTDVDDLLAYYQRTLEALKREHPEIRFAHVTVPLKRRPDDVKSRLNRLIGREVWEDAANARRAEYNRRLLEGFPSDPIFDLAAVEATGPDGRRATFELRGRMYQALDPRYTDDGGHLNARGRRMVGPPAVRFMAEALRRGPRING